MTPFGKQARALIASAGLSQADAAKLLSVALSTLEDWIAEKPRRNPPHALMQTGALAKLRGAIKAPKRNRWTAEKLAMLGTMPDSDVARRAGFALKTVVAKRNLLGIASFRSGQSVWTPENIALIGSMPVAQLAKKLGISRAAIYIQKGKIK